ncbi:MAG: cytochrome P450 [Ktedonobacteraceae bacterium]|nr:cytochrome P450 [Ktedonobacteraceae bacterium]
MIPSFASPLSLKDALHPPYLAKPSALYHQLRANGPVYWDDGLQAWAVTSYDISMAVLRDSRRFSSNRVPLNLDRLPEPLRLQAAPVLHMLARQMLFLDSDDHTRLRRLVSSAFTPRRIEGLRTHIQAIVDQLLDALQERELVEITRDFASQIPSLVIAQLLGAPTEDRAQFLAWNDALVMLLDASSSHRDEELIQAFHAVAAFLDYLRHLISERRTAPRDDLIQGFLIAEAEGEKLSEEEILANCLLLLSAGNSTTMYAISNALLTLLHHPDQLQEIRANPSLMPTAIEELLRYEGPVQLIARRTREDVEIGGRHIMAGQLIIVCLGAANYDPRQFRDPDHLDVERSSSRHLSFGQGAHFCLGAPLARLELEIALTAFLTRFSSPRLASDDPSPHWQPALTFRHLSKLPVFVK